jgi:CubicO group peptidase (beta-lactamase class C family)
VHRSRPLLIAVLVFLGVVTARADEVDDWVKAQLQIRHVPGVAIAVIKDGVLLKAEGYGVADLEHDTSVRTNSAFKIGSASKQFIAAGVMLLVQDGKIRVDDKLGRYLDGIPATWQEITIRQLLSHTSGVTREAPGFDPYKIQPDIDVIKTAYAVPLNGKPGDKYEYSNLGYYVLAEVITRVSGQSWSNFLKGRIFEPLRMTSTRPTTTIDLVPDRVQGYTWTDGQFSNAEDWLALRPSGAFLSTATDMAKWEIALQRDVILSAESKKEMWTPAKLNNGSEYPYGFGWEIDYFPNGVGPTNVPMIRHEGSIPGFRAMFWRLPNQKLTVIVLSNLQNAQLDNLTAGIALHYAPEIKGAYEKRWPPTTAK